MTLPTCRHCNAPLDRVFIDLGFAPPSNSYRTSEDLNRPETAYPLRVLVCDNCHLVQTEDFTGAEQLFSEDYAYFSSTSSQWLDHATRYVDMAVDRFELGSESFVVEVASNDGYLLRNFARRGVPCLGIEPTASTANAAKEIGVPTLQEFFGERLGGKLAKDRKKADLIIGNNVFAHVPDINDFAAGISALLAQDGVVTLEFPHLMRLVEFVQFDTIYHEHYSYLSLISVTHIFEAAGLRIFDVEELPTHGGSLRVYGCKASAAYDTQATVDAILAEEARRGMNDTAFYDGFQAKAEAVKDAALSFLLSAKADGKRVAGYGAAAKGNTFLNFAGVKPDLLPYVCDRAAAKQGKFMPGSHIPIRSVDTLLKDRPDFVIVLPWNIVDEVAGQLSELLETGTRLVTFVPDVVIR
jgi:2-polyprenyl-3-methyl-5-hydroxy-6-metoxy-1,4-benzoquinol methylase